METISAEGTTARRSSRLKQASISKENHQDSESSGTPSSEIIFLTDNSAVVGLHSRGGSCSQGQMIIPTEYATKTLLI